MKASFKKIKLIIVILSLFVFSSGLIAQNLQDGLRYMELYQLKHAKAYFNNAIKQNPKNSQAWLYLGEVQLLNDNADSANICFTKGIEANPADAYNYVGLAKLLMKKGDAINSKINIDKALKMMKGNKDAKFYVYLSQAYSYNKNYDQALQFLDKAKDVNKSVPEIYVEKGDVLMFLNRAGDAANEYDRALFFKKDFTKAYFEIGKLYVLAWNYDEALKAFQNVIKLDSNYTPVYKDLGELYYRANKNAMAANSYSKYIAKAELNPSDIARYAQMLFFSNNYSKSSEVIDRYLKGDSNNFVLLRLKAYDSYELKNYNVGLKAMKKMLTLVNKDNKLITTDYEYYGKFLANDKKDSLAIINFLMTIKLDSTKNYLYDDIAHCFENLNKYQSAADIYKKIIKTRKNPGVDDYYTLGKTCYIIISDPTAPVDTLTKRKFANRADSAFDVVIKQLPDKYYGYIYRARIGSVMDPDAEKGLAKPWYEQAIKIMEPTPDKFKKELVEAYKYIGFYLFVKKDYKTSKTYWEKVLTLDPNDSQAKEAINGMEKMKAKPKPKPQQEQD